VGYFIAAFDVATACGCCDGLADGSPPRYWTWRLEDAGEGRPRRLSYLRRFCDAYFAQQQVDEVVYELPLSIGFIVQMMKQNRFVTSEDVLMMLRGSIGVLESCAAFAGVPIVRGVDIKDARKHLLGRRTFPEGEAKAMTIRGCNALGWAVENDNEADACAIWSLTVGQHNPRLAAATRAAYVADDGVPTARAPKAKRPRRGASTGLLF
jgi:hypothetical protein